MIHDLTRLGIIQQDTLIVGTNPVIATLILAGRRDITQIYTLQTCVSSDVLVHTILIRSNPDAAIIGLADGTKGVITDRGLVVFIIQELFPLIIFHVNDNKAIVVAHHPQPVILIDQNVPYHQGAWNAVNTPRCQIFRQRGIPLVGLLIMHKHQIQHATPPVAVSVDIESVLLTVDTSCFIHPTVYPVHLTLVTIHTNQFTIVGNHQQFISILRNSRDTKARIQLLVGITQFDGGNLLVIGMVDIHGLLKVLHPDVSLRVDVQPLHITILDAQLSQFSGSLAFEALRHRVIDTVVHTLSHPQFPVSSFKHTVRIVITHRGGIAQIRIVGFYSIAVITVQAIGCSNPHVSLGVFEDIVNL